jgi:CubicO group peptidase (beta-lactamase class C family)
MTASQVSVAADVIMQITARMERIENGLLPETALHSEMPQKCALADRMAYYETPGVSVAVFQDYRIEWAHGYGMVEAGAPDPVTTETLFQAASISKPVTAMAALRLVQEGRIDLDEDVNRYLTSWKVPPVGDWQPRVTLRQLLSHTAGLTLHGFPGYLRSRPLPTVVQILNGEPPANTAAVRVNTVPGTQVRYSGGGTTIVQLLLTDLLGRPFRDIMRELVLDPLEMAHSTYEQPLPPERAGYAATGHANDAQPLEGKSHIYPEMAAASLWTTASDLARFAIEIQLSRQGRSNRVLSVETVNEMLSPQVEAQFGLGPVLEGNGETARFGHSGGNAGFVCNLTAYKNRGQGAVVMVNSERGWPMIFELHRAIAQEYGWPDYLPASPTIVAVPAESLAAYVGSYELRPNFHLNVTQSADGLHLEPTGQPAFPLHAKSATEFFACVVAAEIRFVTSDAGAVTGLTFMQNGKELMAKRRGAELSSLL